MEIRYGDAKYVRDLTKVRNQRYFSFLRYLEGLIFTWNALCLVLTPKEAMHQDQDCNSDC